MFYKMIEGKGSHLIGKRTEHPGALPVRNKRNSRKSSNDDLRLLVFYKKSGPDKIQDNRLFV